MSSPQLSKIYRMRSLANGRFWKQRQHERMKPPLQKQAPSCQWQWRLSSEASPPLNTKSSIAADAFGRTANLKHQVVNGSGRVWKQRQHKRMKPPLQKQTQIAADAFESTANLKHQVVNCSRRFWKHRQP